MGVHFPLSPQVERCAHGGWGKHQKPQGYISPLTNTSVQNMAWNAPVGFCMALGNEILCFRSLDALQNF
jgi:hypothetical protein